MIGVKDAKWGERPLALVVLQAGRRRRSMPTRSSSTCSSSSTPGIDLEVTRSPSASCSSTQLAKTSVGKLDKKVMRDKYGT